MFKHILVTGGAGFIGSNFVRFVLKNRPETRVTNLDKLVYSGNLHSLEDVEHDPRYRFVHGDVCDHLVADRLLTQCDAVVHMAAESHVDRSIMDAGPFVQTNVHGTQVLLDGVRRVTTGGHPAPRFLQVSTDEVYGSLPLDKPELKFTEDTPLAPNSPYAATKAAADCIVRAYHHTFGMDVLITRCSNNFGPYQFPEKVIPLFVTNLIEGEQVPLYGDGRNVRDWIHVEDHCRALVAILEADDVEGQTFNIAGGNERSVLEIAGVILDRLKKPASLLQNVTDRVGHDRRYAIDAARLEKKTGFKPEVEFQKGIAATIDWYVANRPWWDAIRSGEFQQYYSRTYGSR
jgi:dTDP-glucose 4,6-dehydratase